VAGALFLALALAPRAALSSGDPRTPGDILRQFAAPGDNPCGLAWDGKHLWVGDNDSDKIYKLNPADGKVLASFDAPDGELRGLVWHGQHLWSSDNGTRRLYKLERADGAVRGTLKAPVSQTQGRQPELGGLTSDGEYLWSGVVSGWSSRMSQVDPANGSVIRSYFTLGCPRGLASDGTFIWSATDNGGRRSGIVYKYKLSDGLHVSQFDTPGNYPTGLAFDGQCLWCVDRETKKIYRLAAD
jgi:outer membrane protein assembly factor BamB